MVIGLDLSLALLSLSQHHQRHSFMSRLLFTCVPSEMYTTKTLDVLIQAMVTDLEDLYHNGIEAACPESPYV